MTRDNLRLTAKQELVLLTARNFPVFGLQVIDMVSEASDGKLQIGFGTLYPTLKKLQKRKLLEQLESTTSFEDLKNRDNKHRTYYQITALGMEALELAEQTRLGLRKWGLSPSS